MDYDSLLERISRLEQRIAMLNPVGPVAERDHEKGIRIRVGGTDSDPVLSPWIQPGDRSGASRYLPEVGEQVMALSHGGDLMQATVLPLTHSKDKKNPAKDADETVHHNRDGQRHSVKKGAVVDKADKTHTRVAGNGSLPGKALEHELNKQLAGIRAALTQHDNNIAGLHDATSKLRQIAQIKIPELATLTSLLNGDASSLEAAAQGVVGKLEGYVASTMKQMVSKLTGGFLDNVAGIVSQVTSGQLNGIMDQLETAAIGIPGAPDLIGSKFFEARGLISGGVDANSGALTAKFDQIAASVAGHAAEAALGPLIAQMRGSISSAVPMLAGLGDLLDGQKNLVKGMTKSYRLGGD